MPDTLDLTFAVREALLSFPFRNYGEDCLEIDLTDPALEILAALTIHLVKAVQNVMDYE